jgi:hypothetical protein
LFVTYSALVPAEHAPITNIILSAKADEGYVGDTFYAEVSIDTDTPINVIEASLLFPNEQLEAKEISQDGSLIDLWIKEPNLETSGAIYFSGGILRAGGFVKTGKAFTVVFTATNEGSATIRLDRSSFALSDGKGTLITPKTNEIVFHIKKKPAKDPDMNDSGTINLVDAGLWLTNIFKPYDTRNDLNGDGAISLRDMYFFW